MVERYKALLDNLPEVFKGSPQTTRQALADLFGEVQIVQDGETIFAECQNLYGRVLGVSKCGSGGLQPVLETACLRIPLRVLSR